MSPPPGVLRAALAFASLSGWLTLLLLGFAGGGAVHVLLLAAFALFPWRALRD